MANAPVTKIYKISTLGYTDLHSQLQQVQKDFAAIKQAKIDAEKALASGGSSAQTTALKQQLNDIKVAMAEMDKQSKQLEADLKAQQIARKEQIQQIKDATALQNAQAQQQAANARTAKQNISIEVGSYNELLAKVKEFYAVLKNTPKGSSLAVAGQSFTYDEAIAEFQRLSAAEQAFRRQFAGDKTLVGEYTSGIVQAFRQMGLGDIVSEQVAQATTQLRSLANEAAALKAAFTAIKTGGIVNPADLDTYAELDTIIRETGTDGQEAMRRIQSALISNVREANELRQQITSVNNELRGSGDIGDRITTGLSEGFKNLKGQVASFAVSFFGIQAALNGIIQTFDDTKRLTDQYEDLRRVLGLTAEQFNNVRDSIRQIDTRTNLNDLFDIGIIAAKAGVAEENIAGVTRAIDALKQVAGTELGDVDEATTSIVKLINIFVGPGQVNSDNVLKFGNALIELANAGVASGGFLVEFAKRLAGMQGITGITIQSVLGLAAAFEEQGSSAEVAATATTQILAKVGADIAKYAAIAKKPVEEYRALLRTNPAEALIELAEGLKGDAKAFDEIAPKFVDLEAKGVRVQATFGIMADKADFFRQKIGIASAALQNTNAILTGSAAKQEDFAATIDKIGKSFEVAFSNPSFLKILTAAGEALLFIAKAITAIPFSLIITGLTLWTAAWAYARGNIISNTIALQANNAQTLLGTIRQYAARIGLINLTEATAVQTVATTAQTGATVAQATATEAATVATEELNAATKLSPLGLILGLIALFLPAITAFSMKIKESSNAINEQNRLLHQYYNVQKDLDAQVQSSTSKTKNNVGELVNIIKTEVHNLDLRKSAYTELIKISPDFVGTLDDQFQATDRLNKAYEAFVINLDKVARAQAIKNTKQKIEDDRAAAQSEVFNAKIAKDQEEADNKVIQSQNKVTALKGLSSSNLGASGAAFSAIKDLNDDKSKAYDEALAKAKAADNKAKAFDAFMQTANDDDKKALIAGLGGTQTIDAATASEGSKQTLDVLKQRLKDIDAQIFAMDQIANKDKAQLKKLQALRATRTEILKEIKDFGGSVKDVRDKLSGSEVNNLNDVESQRKNDIAQLELEYAQIKKVRDLTVEEQVSYLNRLRTINDNYDAQKMSTIKGHNAAELAERASLNLKIIQNDIDTTDKIKEVYKKAYDEKAALLQKQYETTTAVIKLKVQVVEENPDATFTERALAEQRGDAEQLQVATKYYADLISLAQIYGQKTNGIEEEMQKTNADIVRKGLDDVRNITEAKLKDIETSYDRHSSAITAKYDNLRINILAGNKSSGVKDANLSQVDRFEELEQATAKLSAAQKAYNDIVLQPVRTDGKGAVTDEMANQLKHGVEAAMKELDALIRGVAPKVETLKDLFQNKLAKLFNFDVNTDKGKAAYQALSDTISMAFQTAGNAMNAYFDSEKQRIDASVKQQEKLIDVQTAQLTARSQSQAESTAIEAEAQAKKDAIEKAAFEKEKKGQIAQTEINLATQLGNLAVIAFSPANPINLITGGAWGAIFYGIQAALAIANAAINIKKIKSATYAFGGNPDMETTMGGRVKGRKHTEGGNPFVFKGRVFEDEVDELNVIRTKNVSRNQRFTVTGTQSQIASALNVAGGGKMFDAGAILKRFDYGGGVTLQQYSAAPVFVPSSNTTIINNSSFGKDAFGDLVGSMQDMVQATNNRIDRLEVVQQTNSVTKAQRKEVKQKQIGTL